MNYKRDKKGIELSGDPEDVKGLIQADLILSHINWMILITLTIILLVLSPKVSVIPFALQWLMKRISLLSLSFFIASYLYLFLSE